MKLWYTIYLALQWRQIHRDLRSSKAHRWDEFQRIMACYSESHRHYHVLRHLYQTIKMARDCYKDEIDSRSVSWVVAALFYHDVVYTIGSQTNEEDSAAQWRRYAAGRFGDIVLHEVSDMIIMTKSHKLQSGAELMHRIMNDCDMSILAADEDEYMRYARNIWCEYRVAGREAYREGRLNFLRNLDTDNIFHTNVPSSYMAAMNVALEIETLEDHPERIMVD